MKHLFPYLNADDRMSKENGRGPPLVTRKVDFCIPLELDDKSVENYFQKQLMYALKHRKIRKTKYFMLMIIQT